MARKAGCPLSASVKNILSAISSHSLCGLSSLIENQFFSEPGPMNDHCPFPNLFAYETSRAFDSHSFSLPFDSQEMTSSLSCNVVNLGKMFHSNSIGSPSILSKFLQF